MTQSPIKGQRKRSDNPFPAKLPAGTYDAISFYRDTYNGIPIYTVNLEGRRLSIRLDKLPFPYPADAMLPQRYYCDPLIVTTNEAEEITAFAKGTTMWSEAERLKNIQDARNLCVSGRMPNEDIDLFICTAEGVVDLASVGNGNSGGRVDVFLNNIKHALAGKTIPEEKPIVPDEAELDRKAKTEAANKLRDAFKLAINDNAALVGHFEKAVGVKSYDAAKASGKSRGAILTDIDTYIANHALSDILGDAAKTETLGAQSPEPASGTPPIDDVKAARISEPEPKNETQGEPAHAVDVATGEIIEAAIVPYNPVRRALDTVQASVSILDTMRAREILVKGIDFGVIPGVDKPTLLKPGAEKLCKAFGYCPEYEEMSVIRQWTGAEPFFSYEYKCKLIDIASGKAVATGIGNCNSFESKYRWRWVQAHDVDPNVDLGRCKKRTDAAVEFAFAIDKAETTGKYGKPADYWQKFRDAIAGGTAKKIQRATSSGKQMDAWEISTTFYRVPNEDVFSQVNTISKMAQKRALVAAVLIGCNASRDFTQDVEDMDMAG